MDVGRERVMSFAESAKFVGKLMGKAKVAVQTVHRWATKAMPLTLTNRSGSHAACDPPLATGTS